MKNSFLRWCVGTFLYMVCSINAQNDTLKQEKYLHHYVSVSPLAIFSGMFRADYEYIFKNKQYGIVATGLFGSTEHTKNDKKFIRTSSGLEIGNKLYSLNINNMKAGGSSFYINMGLRYQYLSFEYEDEVWRSSMDDSTGVPLYRLSKAKIYPKAHRFSLVPQTGFVIRNNRFLADFYFGVSLYREIIKGNENNIELPLNGWNNFGLHHSTIFAGVKLGVLFP